MNIPRPAPGPGRNRRMTSEEETSLLMGVDANSNPMLGWIVRIALETVMRTSEIVTLRRPQIEIERCIVRLLQTKNTHPRTVPLTSSATELFRSALAHPIRPLGTDLIFFGEPGRQGFRGPYAFDRVWQETKKKQGLKDFHFHDLRHEAVSRFVEAGFSDQEVSAISGHKSMQMLKRYTHLRAEDLVARMDGVNRVQALLRSLMSYLSFSLDKIRHIQLGVFRIGGVYKLPYKWAAVKRLFSCLNFDQLGVLPLGSSTKLSGHNLHLGRNVLSLLC